jgi:hypothetical protein
VENIEEIHKTKKMFTEKKFSCYKTTIRKKKIKQEEN